VYPRAQYWSQYCSNNFINNLHHGKRCTLSKVADNTKLGGAADTPDGCAAMQKDLNGMEK